MTKTNPVATPPATPLRWYLDYHLPENELVLLDGAAGVGKSLYLAHLIRLLTQGDHQLQVEMPVLLITTPRQEELRHEHHKQQNINHDFLQLLSFDELIRTATSLADYLAALATALEVHQPRVLILDSLEEVLADFTQADGKPPTVSEFTSFWNELRSLALTQKCTIIVPRQNGIHLSRSYGTFTRTGSAVSRIILTMHYHPINARKRVLTTVKNQRGVAGAQLHLTITEQGQAYLMHTHLHEHVKPSKHPATWQHDPAISSEETEIIEFVTMLMDGKPISKSALMEAVTAGFSKRAYHRVMGRMKLDCIRDKRTREWYWIPSVIMRFEAAEKHAEATARTADEGVRQESSTCPPEQRKGHEEQGTTSSPTPRAPAARGGDGVAANHTDKYFTTPTKLAEDRQGKKQAG